VRALQHPACGEWQDDLLAEQTAAFFNRWATDPHPFGDLPVIVILGTQRTGPPAGLSLAEWRSDSLRIDHSKLTRRGRLVTDTASGHHEQLDNPALVIDLIREVLKAVP
jgi:pimeloyl-ACP methyl ester carboxylesterase